MNFLTNINLNGNKLEGAIIENAIIQNVGVDPSSSSLKEGQIWYNSTTHQLKYASLVEGVVTPIVVGEGEVSQEELEALNTALNNRIAALETSIGSEESGLIADIASVNTKADNAVTDASEAKTAAENAQTAANSAQAAAQAAQESANLKVEKVDGVENNIVIFGTNNAIKDSGKTIQDVINDAVAAGAGEGEEINLSNYIQKVANPTEGNLVTLTSEGGIANSGYSVKETLLSGGSTEIPTSNAVALYINEQLSGITQGIVFRGTLNSSNSITVPYNVGDMYYVGEAGTYFGYNCEVGDVFIAKNSKSTSENFSIDDWSVLESNKDIFKGSGAGLVPAVLDSNNLGYLDSTGNWSAPVATRWSANNGKLIADSNGTATWSINHNLGRKDVQVIVYEIIKESNSEIFRQVMAEVALITLNECQITFNTSSEIDANKYHVVIM